MTQIWAITRKELRGYFSSAVAIIFLGTFLAATLFTFFWWDKFFARGVADVRPLFEWLPVLLIFLVAALTMRLWSEEQKVGTIEILLTLPVPPHKLVLGKFLAGLILVAIALGLTLFLPITVALLGDIDPGPVFGGYMAALLLAAAYLAIGLCVSAATDNQIVSLVLTMAICALLYLPGVAVVSESWSYGLVNVVREIGTGTRFASIARGVVDLRDLAYWGGLIAFGLVLNTVMLHAKRWSAGNRSRAVRSATMVTVALVAANLIALNVWLAPVNAARVDLTEDNEFGLSDVTVDLLHSLDEPLVIRGYFSEKSHPLVTPLVPQIRDRLEEYRIAGDGRVRVEIVDPTKDEEIEKEAIQDYGIKTLPFEFMDRREESVVNAYFHILVAYGDQYEVLEFNDLIEVLPGPNVGDVDVTVGNLEYQLTRTIKKLAYGFNSIDAVYATLKQPAELIFVSTPTSMPPELGPPAEMVGKVGEKMAGESGGKLKYVATTPELTQAEAVKLYKQYGIKPLDGSYYFHVLIKVGDRIELVVIEGEPTEAVVRAAIETALRRAAPGFLKTVGLVSPPGGAPQPNPHGGPPQPTRPPQMFQALTGFLGESYQVVPVELDAGSVPDEVDVLIVAGPQGVGAPGQRAIDQFVMRGGAVILFVGRYRLDIQAGELAVEKVDTGLDALLATYGFTIGDRLIGDPESSAFPIPVQRDVRGYKIEQVQLLPYPFFPAISRDQMAEGHVATAGLKSAVLVWPTAVTFVAPAADEADGGKKPVGVTLFKSSNEAWSQLSDMVRPDFQVFPESGFGKPRTEDARTGPFDLAVAATGTFTSHFKGTGDANDKKAEGADGRLLQVSPPDARVVVIGSSGFVSDEGSRLLRRREYEGNIQLVQNLVDWSVEDTDLLTIRARGAHLRRLEEDQGTAKWEIINYALVLLGLLGVVGVSWIKTRRMTPVVLPGRRTGTGTSTSSSTEGDEEEEEEDADEDGDEDEDEDEEESK